MWLSADEARRLSSDGTGTLRLWRFAYRIANCEVGRSYLSGGVPYTVCDRTELTQEEVRKVCSQRERLELWERWKQPKNKRFKFVVEVIIVKGDLSELPRFMQPTGTPGGDYTTNARRAMRGEPEALSAHDLALLTSARGSEMSP
jgi:hypothetical protein